MSQGASSVDEAYERRKSCLKNMIYKEESLILP